MVPLNAGTECGTTEAPGRAARNGGRGPSLTYSKQERKEGQRPGDPVNMRLPDHGRVVEFWKPRVGRRSAELIWRSRWVSALIPYVAALNVIGVFLAVRSHSSVTVAVEWILGLFSVLFAASALVFTFMSLRAASRELGVRLRGFPPMGELAYGQWCRDRGLQPYSVGSIQNKEAPES